MRGRKRRVDFLDRAALLVKYDATLVHRIGGELIAVMHDTLVVGPFVKARGLRRERDAGRHHGHDRESVARLR